jgi:hypothetical protein
MKKVIEELNKKFHEYCNLMQDYQLAMDGLVKLEFNNKQIVIDDIRQRRNKADEKMKEYYQAIQALRKVCPHMLPNNYPAFETVSENFEVCSICGYELRRKQDEKSIDNNQN